MGSISSQGRKVLKYEMNPDQLTTSECDGVVRVVAENIYPSCCVVA